MVFLSLMLAGAHAQVSLNQVEQQQQQAKAFQLPASGFLVDITHYIIGNPQPLSDAAIAAGESGPVFLAEDGTVLSKPMTEEAWCQATMQGSSYAITPNGAKKRFSIDAYAATAQAYYKWDKAQEKYVEDDKNKVVKCNGSDKKSRVRMKPGLAQYGEGWGTSDDRYQVIPFRTIAIDPRSALKIGRVYFIPELVGQVFYTPDPVTGKTKTIKHDGYVFAADTGGAIKGLHIDLFTGESPSDCGNPPSICNTPKGGIQNEAHSFVHLIEVEDPYLIQYFETLHWDWEAIK